LTGSRGNPRRSNIDDPQTPLQLISKPKWIVPQRTFMDFAHSAFRLRPTASTDFPFAWPLYRELMQPLTVELLGRWNETGQKRVVEAALAQEGTFIIALDGSDAGWLQVSESSDSVYLGQLYLAPGSQNRGIGTVIVTELMDKARGAGKTLNLDVMKNNRARFLYQRLGFQVIGESEHKLHMRWRGSITPVPSPT
jgi:ribosomal protein S18 acetylase RimI-like enzyme